MAKNTEKIFIDANVLVEVSHQRRRANDAIAFIRARIGQLAISPLTVHLVMYFGRKVASQQTLAQLLSNYVVLPMDSQQVAWAFNHICDNDFENVLQLACAVDGGCTRFVTLDGALARRYATLSNIAVEQL